MSDAAFLADVATRHQVYLERLKSGERKKVEAFLRKINKAARKSLLEADDVATLSRSAVLSIISQIRKDVRVAADEFLVELFADIEELAVYEAEFTERAIKSVVNIKLTTPPVEQLHTAVFTNPLSIDNVYSSTLMEPFVKSLKPRTLNRVSNAIRMGYYQGDSTPKILQSIKGTKAAGYTDGILKSVDRDIETVVRTSLQHTAHQAREAVAEYNDDIIWGIRWVSSLDNRTSQICRSLDGREFPQGEGPRPPIHYNCRSTYIYLFKEPFDFLNDSYGTRAARAPGAKRSDPLQSVPADMNYYQWLKTQPVKVQKSAMAPWQYKVWKKGGLSQKKFDELMLGKNFQGITMEEFRALEPLALERAGI